MLYRHSACCIIVAQRSAEPDAESAVHAAVQRTLVMVTAGQEPVLASVLLERYVVRRIIDGEQPSVAFGDNAYQFFSSPSSYSRS